MSTSRQQENGGAGISPTPKYELHQPRYKLIGADKKLVRQIQHYEEQCLKYVFTYAIFNEPHPKCVLCFEIVDNDSMKPS